MDLVSFLVPVYNVEPYLSRCLDSLTGQTYPNIEIVLINDGSTDGSLKIIEDYQMRYPNIYVYSYENSGISKTRNRALSKARGEFVMFVDSDDFIETDAVMTMMDLLEKENLDLVQCGFRMDYKYGSFLRPGCGYHIMNTAKALHCLSQGKYLNNYPWGKLIRKSCFDDVKFPEGIKGFEDTFTIFKSIANARRIGTLPNRFYHYVQRRGSLTNRMNLETVYLMRKAYEYQYDYLSKKFPNESFSYDLQYYNTDMVIIYTLIVFCRRKDHARFIPGNIEWRKLPVWPLYRAAYEIWLGLARLKLGNSIVKEENA